MGISRRHFLASSTATVAAGVLRGIPLLGRAPAQGRFETLRGSVGTFTLRGGTIGFLLAPDGAVVVDAQYPDTAPVCLEGLQARGAGSIDLLVNTHHHADHTAGNQVFRSTVKQIVAHARVPELQRAAAAAAQTEEAQAYADVTFAETWKVDLGDETVSARHHGPAHTGDDAVITFERANVVHMGDLVFNRVHPRIDRPAGASIANWIATLGQVADAHARDTIYIFGHGSPQAGITGARADLEHMADYLTAVLAYVRKGVADGRSREEIVKAEALRGFEQVTALVPALSLAAVLAVAFDELTAR